MSIAEPVNCPMYIFYICRVITTAAFFSAAGVSSTAA
jgi:hypothetical protein